MNEVPRFVAGSGPGSRPGVMCCFIRKEWRSSCGGAILNQVDGQRTVADIVASLEQQFPAAGSLGKDVSDFLQDARQQHWIELS